MCKDLPPPLVIKPCRVPSCPRASAQSTEGDGEGADREALEESGDVGTLHLGTATSSAAAGGVGGGESSRRLLTSNKKTFINQLIYHSLQGSLSLWLIGSLIGFL